ncbi:MAG: uracil-DNA glycosylase [Erysipelotrichaceae bacterium]|nr:uracil-DNA glycosylase [Erysipelotrichaceae bacterium]
MNWQDFIYTEAKKDYFIKLKDFVDREYKTKQIYPPSNLVFEAFKNCEYDKVKVIIIGQDPYHQKGQAHGLSFSVNKGVKIPKSLINIYKELYDDLGIKEAKHGYLMKWEKQGVFLLNSILTVEDSKPSSHANVGWEIFTDNAIKCLDNRKEPLVFILWGNFAKKKANLIKNKRHLIITSAHPSPLSAYNGFFNSKPFSKCNNFLIENGISPIDWELDE